MNDLQIFENSEFGAVRTVMVNGKTYFVGSDVAKALGYANPRDAISRHCRGVVKHDIGVQTGVKADGTPAMQNVEMLVIPEGDIYRLISNSHLPSAEKFESWVFDEVIPSIRKHGMYAVDELIDDPDLAIKAFTALKEERQRNKQLQEENESMRPKADYFDALVDKKLNTNVRDTAKELGVKEKVFVNFLLENGFVYRQGKSGKLRPYAQYCESGSGLFVLKDAQNENNGWAGQQMFITPKGKETFRLLLERETEK